MLFLSASPEPELDIRFGNNLAVRVYTETWERFYDWETDECASILKGLSVSSRIDQTSQSDSEFQEGDYNDSYHMATDDDDGYYSFCFEDFEENLDTGDPLVTTSISIPARIAAVDPTFRPYPRYTICTSLSENVSNILLGNPSTHFIPFADDPTFDSEKYLAIHVCPPHWQWDYQDPDHEIIQLETARRLHFQHGLSLDEIPSSIPGFPKLRVDDTGGLIWAAMQRDPLNWPESQTSEWPRLTLRYASIELIDLQNDDGLFDHVEKMSVRFCPDLNCVRYYDAYCKLHRVPAIEEDKPVVLSTAYQEGKPCGISCFINIGKERRGAEDLVDLWWTNGKDVTMLRSILKLAPDALPCDLAIICKKNCAEVFANRVRVYPDEGIQKNIVIGPPTKRLPPSKFKDVIPMEHNHTSIGPYITPCSHPGPCVANICSCFDAQYHCTRNCRCSTTCHIRRKGCKCGTRRAGGKGGRKCCVHAKDCPCIRESRECDPELCTKCCARGTKGKCQNNTAQKVKFGKVLIEIKQTKWGQGAFATQHIAANTCIGEYVGEFEGTHEDSGIQDQREMLNAHTGLNYAFSLDRDNMLDSKSAGNGTRYLNHEVPANCYAQTTTVHGQHRIFLYTTNKVGKGKELFLDYGEAFWSAKRKGGSDKDGGEDENSMDLLS